MNFPLIGRLTGALVLSVGLAGCVDMTNDIYVTSATTARATITTVMGADVYPMIKAGAAGEDSEPFCAEAGASLTENADGSATCIIVSEGSFDQLQFSEDSSDSQPTFVTNADGTVRIGVPTGNMMANLGLSEDPETAAMLQQLFDGRYVTIRLGGAQIVETNMERAPDSANYVEARMALLALLDGTANLPAELYAIIRP